MSKYIYKKVYITESSYRIYQYYSSGIFKRIISELYPDYIDWCKKNTLEVIPYSPPVYTLEEYRSMKLREIESSYENETLNPVYTPYNIIAQKRKIDLDLLQDGIKSSILEDSFVNPDHYTTEELYDINIGCITGSIFEKSKSLTLGFCDYYNQINIITLDVARGIALIQANEFAADLQKKFILRSQILNTTSVGELESINW